MSKKADNKITALRPQVETATPPIERISDGDLAHLRVVLGDIQSAQQLFDSKKLALNVLVALFRVAYKLGKQDVVDDEGVIHRDYLKPQDQPEQTAKS